MKLVSKLSTLVLLLFTFNLYGASTKFAKDMNYEVSYELALKKAKKTNKPIKNPANNPTEITVNFLGPINLGFEGWKTETTFLDLT